MTEQLFKRQEIFLDDEIQFVNDFANIFFNWKSPMQQKNIQNYQQSNVDVHQFNLNNYFSHQSQHLQNQIHLQNYNNGYYSNQNIHKQRQYLIHQANIQQQSQKKSNFPKFLLKIFRDYFEHQVNNTNVILDKQKVILIRKKLQKTKYLILKSNTKLLDRFFKTDPRIKNDDKHMERLIMRMILRQYCIKQIIQSNYVKKKKAYLIASKVYALRCMSSSLVSRMRFI